MDIVVDSFDFQNLRIIDENGQYVSFDLQNELKVNESNLLQEMLQQPSKYIYWASLLEKINYFQEVKEIELETKIAQLDKSAREQCKTDDVKPTKDIVDAYIKRHPEYLTAKKTVQHYEYISSRIARIVKAFEQRKDMLQSYGKQIAEQKIYGQGAGSTIEKNIMPQPQWGQ